MRLTIAAGVIKQGEFAECISLSMFPCANRPTAVNKLRPAVLFMHAQLLSASDDPFFFAVKLSIYQHFDSAELLSVSV